MIKNIKIHNIPNIIEISKSIKPNNKNFIGPMKLNCDVLNYVMTQGWLCPRVL